MLKNQSTEIANAIYTAKYDEQQKNINQANQSLNERRMRKENSDWRRTNYNRTVSNSHVQQADEHQRVRDANEMRIRQLEEIEQRMVNDLQNTLQAKN